jgi:hypothetical protein
MLSIHKSCFVCYFLAVYEKKTCHYNISQDLVKTISSIQVHDIDLLFSPGRRNGVSRKGLQGYPLSPKRYPRSGSEKNITPYCT